MIRTWMLAALLAVGVSTAALAQDATGDWIGKMKTPGPELTITVHVQAGANGALEGVAGSPDETGIPFPMEAVSVKDGTLTFSVPMAGATYSGKWDAAIGGWVGALSKGGVDMPLTLKKNS